MTEILRLIIIELHISAWQIGVVTNEFPKGRSILLKGEANFLCTPCGPGRTLEETLFEFQLNDEHSLNSEVELSKGKIGEIELFEKDDSTDFPEVLSGSILLDEMKFNRMEEYLYKVTTNNDIRMKGYLRIDYDMSLAKEKLSPFELVHKCFPPDKTNNITAMEFFLEWDKGRHIGKFFEIGNEIRIKE